MGKETMDKEIDNVLPEVVAPDTKAAEIDVKPEAPAISEVVKPKQTAEENAAFAALRRERDALKKENQKSESLINGFKSGLKAQGYEGTDEDILAKLYADAHGVSQEEARQKIAKDSEIHAKEEMLTEREQKVQEKEDALNKAVRDIDLMRIKAEFPDVSVSDTLDLGDEFVDLMKKGKYDAVKAYKIVRAANAKEAPPSMGSVKGATVIPEKDFYTEAELVGLVANRDKLHDKSIVDKAYNSLFKLK